MMSIKKKGLFVLLIITVATLFFVSAALADDPMKVSMELSSNKFYGPETIDVSITVTNVGDVDMPGPVTLYYPNGKKVEEFGSPMLKVGASKHWSGEWTVTRSELEAGKITFKITYSVYGGSEEDGSPILVKKTKNFSKKITFTGADPEISVERTIKPTTARKGQEISVDYEIKNTGTVEVTSVNIKENSSISTKSGTIDSVKPGESKTYTFTAVMGTKDLTSNATVSYKSGGKTYTRKVKSETIKYSEDDVVAISDVNPLSITVSMDNQALTQIPATVSLTIKVSNNGDEALRDVYVKSGNTVLHSFAHIGPGKTASVTREVWISKEGSYLFSAEYRDNNDSLVKTDSPVLEIKLSESDEGDAGKTTDPNNNSAGVASSDNPVDNTELTSDPHDKDGASREAMNEEDDQTVVITMGDQVITRDKVKAQVKDQLHYMATLYAMYGYNLDTTDPDVIALAQNAVLEALKEELALNAKAKELGLDQLTDEEKETVAGNARETYDLWAGYVKPSDTEGMDEEAIARACEENLLALGVTMDYLTESETKTFIENKVKQYAVKDVTVTEEEIRNSYDTMVERDKVTYEGKAGSWAIAANNGSTLYYTPAGVRRVKQILTKFKDEDKTVIDEAKKQVTEANTARTTAQNKIDAAQGILDAEGATEEDKAKAREDLNTAKQQLDEADKTLAAASTAVQEATDKAFANIDADADTILAQLSEGADWQTLMDEKNQDPGMKNNEKGYAIAADMTGFDPAFVEAAMALQKPGDYSGKVRGINYGYYIIRYESDEAEGAVPLENVKEKIGSDLLSGKQNETYQANIDKWINEAGIVVNYDALNSNKK